MDRDTTETDHHHGIVIAAPLEDHHDQLLYCSSSGGAEAQASRGTLIRHRNAKRVGFEKSSFNEPDTDTAAADASSNLRV